MEVPVHILLTQRKLATGSYDEWRKAWMSEDQEWPAEAIKAYEVIEEVTPR